MPGKPYQSILIPYQNEIMVLRSQKPPVSYEKIAQLLRQKYGLCIQRAAIGKFVKARSGGRKVYFFKREVAAKKPTPMVEVKTVQQSEKPKFEFKYSERYNLTRLPPDVAAERRKKLEEKGH